MRSSKFKLKRGTASDWTAINPVLENGEPGYEEGTGRFKIGDGETAWADLGYSPPSEDGGGVDLSAVDEDITVVNGHALSLQGDPVSDPAQGVRVWYDEGFGRLDVQSIDETGSTVVRVLLPAEPNTDFIRLSATEDYMEINFRQGGGQMSIRYSAEHGLTVGGLLLGGGDFRASPVLRDANDDMHRVIVGTDGTLSTEPVV